jgi:uncharacterized protein (DUF169 family)
MQQPFSRDDTSVTLVHELRHVAQFESNAVGQSRKENTEKYRRELEAYCTGAHYAMGLREIENRQYTGSVAVANHLYIEGVRSAYALKSDPFYPHKELRQAIEETGIDSYLGSSGFIFW